MMRNDADMITSKPRIIGTTLHPAVHGGIVSHQATILIPVDEAETPAGYRIGKRTFDIILAGLALVLLSPLLLLIYLAIKIEDGGPAVIVQERVGLGGRIYDFYKFRSMTVGVDHTQGHKAFAQQVIRGEITQGPRSNGGVLKPTGDGRVITRSERCCGRLAWMNCPNYSTSSSAI